MSKECMMYISAVECTTYTKKVLNLFKTRKGVVRVINSARKRKDCSKKDLSSWTATGQVLDSWTATGHVQIPNFHQISYGSGLEMFF